MPVADLGRGRGFLGVDVFFAISGFLITALLLAQWRRDELLDVVAFPEAPGPTGIRTFTERILATL